MIRMNWPMPIGPLCASVGIGVAVALLGAGGPGGDEPTKSGQGPEVAVGVESDGDPELGRLGGRVPWTTSRVVGSPEPPRPYVAEVAFPGLTFDRALDLAVVPGTGRLAVAQHKGEVLTFPDDPGAVAADLMLDLEALHPDFTNLYGLAFHPDHATNGRFYLCYTVGNNVDDGTRVSEFRSDRADPPRADPSSERVLLTWYAGGHNGGSLQFGPEDGCLYISTGDGANPSPPDPFLAGQDLTTLLSKILRIDVDGRDPGRAYRVPPDNPFVDRPGARPEIWSYGFRNPWRMSFDRESGDLWVGDVGWELWELVHRVGRGGNYGWSLVEGRQPVMPDGPRGPTPVSPPIVDHPHSEAASITGGHVSRGDRLDELKGDYIYGDFQTGTVWGLRVDGDAVSRHEVLAETPLRLVAFGMDQADDLLLIDYEQTNQIYRLVPNPAAAETNRRFPRLLSETGLFASVADHEPALGVVPYAINAPLWADGTEADRLMAVPGLGRIDWQRDRLWKFPEGSVLARTVTIDLDPGGRGGRRRLETQILHFEDESWRPYSYRWNDEQTDARLVGPEGDSVALEAHDPAAPGGVRAVGHRIAARSECVLCHNPWAGEGLLFGRQSATPLTANTLQMNADRIDEGRAVDQLRAFERLGYFREPLPEAPGALPRLADPYDEALDLDARARSYLQVNCSHCHRFGAGGTAAMFLTFNQPIEQTGALGVPPMQGAFGIDDARIIAPGDPFGSVLYYRMAKLGAGRMPRVGSRHVDARGLDLLYRWIAGLEDGGEPGPFDRLPSGASGALDRLAQGKAIEPEGRSAAFRGATGTIRGALALLRRVDEGAFPEPIVGEVVTMAREHPTAEVRDLFERFVPESDRVRRIGDAVGYDFEDLLALDGDAGRGRAVFFGGDAAQCRTCHRIGGEGTMLGPDLDGIGAKYPKPELLDHITDPSRVVEPEYASYLLETSGGLLYSGMLVERTDRLIVLKDARGETIRVDADDVETLVPQPQSLMPEGLLDGLTEQEAADLLEFLSAQTGEGP